MPLYVRGGDTTRFRRIAFVAPFFRPRYPSHSFATCGFTGLLTFTLRQRLRSSRGHASPAASLPASSAEKDAIKGRKRPPENAPKTGGRFYLGLAATLEAFGFSVPTLCSVVVSEQIRASATEINFDSHYVMLGLVTLFAVTHSGLASLRPKAVSVIGERLYRVMFALVSIPSAVATITYFIAHRYDGAQLWTLQGVWGMHEFCYALTFLSFLLLYPATFNLLEVAAVQKPAFRIYETGVMRITRHPQLWGQVLWCIAHSVWLGTSMSLTVSAGLIAHHCFAVWNGDRRLRDRYGVEWDAYAARTSVLPFRAIFEGRQELIWREFPIKAYAGVVLFVLGVYAAHPAMLRAVGNLRI